MLFIPSRNECLTKDLEFAAMKLLLNEITLVEDLDDNGAIYLKDFTFFDMENNFMLASYMYNMSDYDDTAGRIAKFTISFVDYMEWYYCRTLTMPGLVPQEDEEGNTVMVDGQVPAYSNNPANVNRYYCSKNTGPGWKKCREVAAGGIGTSAYADIGPVRCKVEKISSNTLKYTESDAGVIVPLNHGLGYFLWNFTYERP